MNTVLARWNRLLAEEAAKEILACCGSTGWAGEIVARRPFNDDASLLAASDEVWWSLATADWLEAFSQHPRIGQRNAPQSTSAQSMAWSAQEQARVADAGDALQVALEEGNREYERRFHRVFIVCATGKSAAEILKILRTRLQNDDATEWHLAAEEQRKITSNRLKKWLSE
jgi:2-oxo-4-hydroxy-4-carboxy-5-ureidoimidazoline decarboxylase